MEEAKAVERRYMENPLLAFSFYTQLQTDVTRREASIAGIDSKKRDMTFVVRGVAFSARSLMTEFDALIRGIERGDVLHRHGWRGKDDVT